MITLQCRLNFQSNVDKEKLYKLMRTFSSCMRYAYNRLLDNVKIGELRKDLQKLFGLNSRYCNDAVSKAKWVLKSCRKSGQNPRKVIFGGRRLFDKLRKKHLNGNDRKRIKRLWYEKGNILYILEEIKLKRVI